MKIALLALADNIHTVRWANALSNRGHAIHLISSHTPHSELDAEVSTHALPIPHPAGYFLNVLKLRQLLRDIKPDVLSVHFASGYGTLATLSRFQPRVLSVWGSDVYSFPQKSKFHRWLLGHNLNSAAWVCSTGQNMANHVSTLYPHLKNISVVPFGIDIKMFSPTQKNLESQHITIGTVKTLEHVYGIDLLIKAFCQVKSSLERTAPSLAEKLRLMIVGKGSLRQELESLAKSLDLHDEVTFVGAVPHEAVPSYLNKFDIYVASSREESFGVAIIEASACEVPAVVTDVGGLPEVVNDGVTGLIARKESVEDLAQHLHTLIADAELRKSMGKAGREKVVKDYDWDDNVQEIENILLDVAENYKRA